MPVRTVSESDQESHPGIQYPTGRFAEDTGTCASLAGTPEERLTRQDLLCAATALRRAARLSSALSRFPDLFASTDGQPLILKFGPHLLAGFDESLEIRALATLVQVAHSDASLASNRVKRRNRDASLLNFPHEIFIDPIQFSLRQPP